MKYTRTGWTVIGLATLLLLGVGCASSSTQTSAPETPSYVSPTQAPTDADRAPTDTPGAEVLSNTYPAGDIAVDEMIVVGNDEDPERTMKEETILVTMTAKRWEFTPAEVRVALGSKVRLEVTSLDVNHGFTLPAYGISETLTPGEVTVLEFTADKPGTHSFFCTVYCGDGHKDMKGVLIVE